jgi:hypothetical protein
LSRYRCLANFCFLYTAVLLGIDSYKFWTVCYGIVYHFLEEHLQVALEVLQVGLCCSLQSPQLSTMVCSVMFQACERVVRGRCCIALSCSSNHDWAVPSVSEGFDLSENYTLGITSGSCDTPGYSLSAMEPTEYHGAHTISSIPKSHCCFLGCAPGVRNSVARLTITRVSVCVDQAVRRCHHLTIKFSNQRFGNSRVTCRGRCVCGARVGQVLWTLSLQICKLRSYVTATLDAVVLSFKKEILSVLWSVAFCQCWFSSAVLFRWFCLIMFRACRHNRRKCRILYNRRWPTMCSLPK